MTAPAIGMAALAVCALAPALAAAQAPSPASSDPASVQGGSYAIEPNHTQVLFSVSHMGFSTFHGQFTQSSGSLSLDAKSPADSRFEIHVPTRSVLTSNAKLTGELKSDAWLNAKADPDITFRSTRVTPTGNGEADVAGDLTLHGQTHPVTLHARLVGAGVNPLDKKYTVGFDLSGTLQRSDFGVKTYVPLIGDTVTLTIAGVFEKQA
ncbi:YceI family protein [Lichenicoccus roseus]|nr:YceI family protein [Lichenicoccus roseus]